METSWPGPDDRRRRTMSVVGDFIIKTGDMVQITITPPTVVPPLIPPIPLVGTSTDTTVAKMAVCLEGDELPKAISTPLPYMSPPYVTPGMGTLKLTLMPNNKSMTTKNGKAILLKGSTFTAEFTVSSPAMMPTPAGPQPDPVPKKTGTAQFITTNMDVKAG
jgi:Contractile injection system spike tip protein